MKTKEHHEDGSPEASLDMSDALQFCLHFTTGLPTEMAVHLAVVAGVLMAHPHRRVAEDALGHLGQAAHAMFRMLEDDEDSGGDGGTGLCPTCENEADAENEDENKGNKSSPN